MMGCNGLEKNKSSYPRPYRIPDALRSLSGLGLRKTIDSNPDLVWSLHPVYQVLAGVCATEHLNTHFRSVETIGRLLPNRTVVLNPEYVEGRSH
jgi:hypothetical protein